MKFTNNSSNRKLLLATCILLVIMVVIWQKNQVDRTKMAADATTAFSADQGRRASTGSEREEVLQADRALREQNARTDVSVTEFPAKAYLYRPQPGGKAQGAPEGLAYIHVPSTGTRISYEANQLGEFPTVLTSLKDTVGVRLLLDGVSQDTPVRVVILDGGTFPRVEGVSRVVPAEKWGGVAFEFITSANIGTHRILVQAAGQESRILDFNALSSRAP